jgi:predicted phosphodiesterase
LAARGSRRLVVRVGFISDIHGNLFALDAVLADLEHHDVDRIVCLGDICFGPQAHECLARVKELGCPVVLGNWDSWSIDGFPPRDDPVGIMLYDIGECVGEALDEGDRTSFARSCRRSTCR